MAEMLLINPRRRKARKTTAKRRVRRASTARRRNPLPVARVMRRRRNPIGMMKRRVMRRRRNPIGMGGRLGMSSVIGMVRDGVMSGVGAVAFGVVHGFIQKQLPDSLKIVPGKIGAGDAVKAIITVVLGQALNGVTRGYSKKAAAASLTVQVYDLLKSQIPQDKFPLGGLGYASPAGIAMTTPRVGPIRRGMNAYTGGTPLLSAYTQGTSQLLNGARRREGIMVR